MEQPIRLAAFFLPHAPKYVSLPDAPTALDDLLHHAWEKGQSPWPQISLAPKDFVTGLAHSLRKARAQGALGELLDQWHLSDLYLVCACLKEVLAAREALEAIYLSKVPSWLGNLRLSEDELDEVRQALRIQLLMGTPKAGPRLATYTGKGPIENWIRISAVRIAFRQGGEPRKPLKENDLALIEAMPAPQPDAELDLILSRYRAEFRQAYRESMQELPSEQKLLLQMHFLERLTTTRLGTLFGVEQSTISRRLKSTREAIYEATKQRLKARLQLSSHEFESLLAAIRSQLDASISQLLEEDHREEEKDDENKKEQEGEVD